MKTLYAVRVSPLGDPASCVSPEVKPCWQGFNWVGDHVGLPHAVCPLGSEAGLAVINRASHILCRHCIWTEF